MPRPAASYAVAVFAGIALAGIALAGCAGHHAPQSPPQPLDIEGPAALPWAGTTIVLRAEQVHRLSPVRWSVTDDQRAWVSPEGTVTFLEPGDVKVHATDGWREGTRAFSIRANPAAQVVMQEKVVRRAAVGDTIRIQGHVYDAEGARVQDAPVAYALVARGDVPPAATVTADGRFVARESGIYVVIAECGRVSGRTIVIVEGPLERAAREVLALRAMREQSLRDVALTAPGGPPQQQDGAASTDVRHPERAPLGDSTLAGAVAAVHVAASRTARVTIDDFDAAPYEGTTLALHARVWTGDDRRADTTAQVLWASSDPDRVYVTQAGRVVFLQPGWVTISAMHGGVTATRRFNVRWLPVSRLALRPSSADVLVGQPLHFRDEAWQPGTIPLVDARANYAVIAHGIEGPVPATMTEDRVFTALQPGVYTVIAELGGVADKITLLVREPPVASR